ncbi:MAG: hypothetical protein ACHQUC_10740, partial [Chlamydiales bacterium]
KQLHCIFCPPYGLETPGAGATKRSIGMHARLSGRPGRCEALHRFIEYITQFDKVWICRREEIADHCLIDIGT